MRVVLARRPAPLDPVARRTHRIADTGYGFIDDRVLETEPHRVRACGLWNTGTVKSEWTALSRVSFVTRVSVCLPSHHE